MSYQDQICVFTAVCPEDREWVPQYLHEMERLGLPFAIHLDRWEGSSLHTAKLLEYHRQCIGVTWQKDLSVEFEERHKQEVFDTVVRRGYKWALAVDIDETFERSAPEHLEQIAGLDAHHVQVTWATLWEDRDHIRVDGPFAPTARVKFYCVNRGVNWRFMSAITNGPKPVNVAEQGLKLARSGLVCLHHGMMTHALRLLHKQRWDRIYSTALKGDPNPYGFWNYALDPSIAAVVVPHEYYQ